MLCFCTFEIFPNPELGLLSVVWYVLPYVLPHVGFLWVLRFLLKSQKFAGRWTGYNKLPLGENMCVHGELQWIVSWDRLRINHKIDQDKVLSE